VDRDDRQRYCASREWALLKQAVRQRSGGKCERCGIGSHDATHHLSYKRFGREKLEDLQALCEACNLFLSGLSNKDPSDLSWYPRARIGVLVSGMQFLKYLSETRDEFEKRGFPTHRIDSMGSEIWLLMEVVFKSEEVINEDSFRQFVSRQMDEVEVLINAVVNKEE
jgi:hypothetical protein